MPGILLIDLDGTVYTSGGAVDGAAAALDELRADGHVLRFLTNTDSKSSPQMLDTIRGKGLTIGADEMFTSVTAVEELLSAAPAPVLMTVTNDAVADQLLARFPGVGPAPTHVVAGDVSDRLSYALMDDAFRGRRTAMRAIPLATPKTATISQTRRSSISRPEPPIASMSVTTYLTDRCAAPHRV